MVVVVTSEAERMGAGRSIALLLRRGKCSCFACAGSHGGQTAQQREGPLEAMRACRRSLASRDRRLPKMLKEAFHVCSHVSELLVVHWGSCIRVALEIVCHNRVS